MRREHLAIVIVLVILASGCGGDGPTTPSPKIPSVAGNYSGTVTMAFPELQQQVTCPASTSVTQSAAAVNIAPIVLTGSCDNMSIPVGQTTIDATGAIPSETGTFTDPDCGTYSYTASGGFFGRDLRMSISATSATCYDFNFTATLTR